MIYPGMRSGHSQHGLRDLGIKENSKILDFGCNRDDKTQKKVFILILHLQVEYNRVNNY